jgi:hypothetical protein
MRRPAFVQLLTGYLSGFESKVVAVFLGCSVANLDPERFARSYSMGISRVVARFQKKSVFWFSSSVNWLKIGPVLSFR